jgi:hypothetical protein
MLPLDHETRCFGLQRDEDALEQNRENIYNIYNILCTLNWILRPPLWSSDQSSWLQIQSSGLDSLHYQIF